ncbi:MAG: HDOD domain-containing protein [Gammaproteobacteria bacterium]|nr:HDOD domain-containing protein [Rhodocyclaceae bacterium]MBU3909962.1 HDOD domain-containing protein [Gammaproteobacteria bacterium]MBU3987904.1 HDOD domain-containing protein [Gammaproteobacteria bacterium]MBU4003935.1 HDOD domain-containing protein [Gammaproteobacteria bacterium]MBU4020182.1 HDOD domain-containing protein [Gammaproteobacteria bacterium]
MIEKPFPDLDAWVAYFSQASIPVLRHTELKLADLRANADKSNARTISSVILHDPMMTLRVLAYIEAKRNKTRNTDITTIERALMMIGMEPFFRDFQELPMIEDQLKSHPRALLGLLKTISRARKAAQWSRDWAIYRHDLDVDEIIVATLLYDFTEILMWCFAPNLALQFAEKQKADRTLRSIAVQADVFNLPLHQIKMALTQAWRLPELLTTLMNQDNADNPRVRNVKLAVDLARHSANGWDDAALPDDYKAIGELLHLSEEAVMRRLGLEIPVAAPEATSTDSQPQ